MKVSLQAETIFIASKAVDFRRGVDGLCSLVVEDLKQSPSSGIYIFYNSRMDKVKILGWHNNGFIMVYKRLESGKFFVCTHGDKIQINSEQLNWLLVGADWRLLSQIECKNNAYF
jgi:transposase